MHEFVACVEPAAGGTESVTVKAWDAADARERLLRLGYRTIHWIL